MTHRRRFKTAKITPLCIALVCVCLPSFAQDQETERQSLPAEIVAEIDSAIEAIEYQRLDLQAIEARLAQLDDQPVQQAILSARRDRIWAEMFDETIGFAQSLATHRENNFDVSEFVDDVRRDLQSFPDLAYAATDRIRERVTFPTDDMPPNEFVLADQRLFAALENLDHITGALISYTEVAVEFDIDTADQLEYLAGSLVETAENRSIFLEQARSDVEYLRASVATLPEDATLADQLSAAESRVQLTADSLQDAIDLMSRLELDSRRYRQQVLTVTGEITTDVLDVSIVSNLVSDWSERLRVLLVEQGPKLIFQVLLVLLIIFVFHQLSKLVQKGAEKAMSTSGNRMSHLLRKMISSSVRNIILMLGVLLAISQFGISLAPLLAGLGIAGFIIGFALQDSLSNFASGVMILAYRPFDVGDVVEAGGVSGKVSSMSLVNTTFMTFDNQTLVVPNNMIWQSVITNLTAQHTRRVDLVFGISYGDDIVKAERVLREIIDEHEACLADPEPIVAVHELGDSSVNFIVRPWVKTDDYWDTYWYLTRKVKLRFDEEGISIPFPQRDVHLYDEKA